MELNFVPVYHAVVSPRGTKADIDRRKIEFFLWLENGRRVYPEGIRGWFFDIYIQGSKYNFKS